MPVEAEATALHSYKMPTKGVNLYVEKSAIAEEEAVKTTNMIWRDGMQKRGGYAKFNANQVLTGKKVTGIHRFYYGIASKQTLASSGTVVDYYTGSDWAAAKTGLTDGAQVLFETWGFNDKCYVANGADAPFSWDGSSAAALTGLGGDVIQFLTYQDRLLYISNTTPGGLGWSASFVDNSWKSPTNTGVFPDSKLYGMVIHAAQVSDAGLAAKVLLAGANGMYLFGGNDLRVPSTSGDYKIDSLATRTGCSAPLTMKWTPAGTVYLGTDKQVYILPYNSLTPVPIGHKITAAGNRKEDGLESIPASQIANASAVYHEGFYKLSIAKTGGTGSFVYEADQSGTFTDNAVAVPIELQTFYHPLSVETLTKVLHHLEFEILSSVGTYNIDYFDTIQKIKNGDILSITDNTLQWGTGNWGTFQWQTTGPSRIRHSIDPAIHTKYLSILIKFTSDADVRIYKIMAEELQQFDPLGVIE